MALLPPVQRMEAAHAEQPRCRTIEQRVYGKERPVCLILRQTGHDQGWTSDRQINFRFTTVDWRYGCRKRVQHPAFVVSLNEILPRNGEETTVIVKQVNKARRSGTIRIVLGKGKHRINFGMAAGSLNPNGSGFGLRPVPCTWHIMVTADDYL